MSVSVAQLCIWTVSCLWAFMQGKKGQCCWVASNRISRQRKRHSATRPRSFPFSTAIILLLISSEWFLKGILQVFEWFVIVTFSRKCFMDVCWKVWKCLRTDYDRFLQVLKTRLGISQCPKSQAGTIFDMLKIWVWSTYQWKHYPKTIPKPFHQLIILKFRRNSLCS